MTHRLILVRHAKSSWDNPQLEDRHRGLSDRGKRTAPVIGKWLAEREYVPAVVLCSSARRAFETWKLLSPNLFPQPRVELSDALYHALPATMIRAIAERPETTVMLVGHNPGIGAFAAGLVRNAPDHPDFHRFPTAATAVIDFAGESWAEARRGTGDLKAFVVPRDLVR